MSRFVVDSWGWIEYLDGSKAGKRVANMIDDGAEIFTHVVTIAEVVSKYEQRRKDGEGPKKVIATLSRIVNSNDEDALGVGKLHSIVKRSHPNFSLADAFVLHAARSLKAKVLTGDPDFKGIDDAVLLA
jgi:predicted nucleic acid-binding protein